MSIKEKLGSLFFFFWGLTYMGTSIVVCSVVVTLNVLLIRPFSIKHFRRIMSHCSTQILSVSLFPIQYWASSDLKLYIDKDVYKKYLGKEHSLCIFNHTTEIDWLAFHSILQHFNILGGMKSYVKKIVKYIPFIGWGLYWSDHTFLHRSYDKDKINLESCSKLYTQYHFPVTIKLFPEGTRFTPKKRDAAIKFVKERGFKLLEHHLIPRTRAFTTVVPILREKVPAIYDLEIVYEGNESTVRNIVLGKHFKVHIYLRRIPMDELPKEEKELEDFLQKLFVEKDKLMDSFLKTGDFFKTSGFEPCEPINIPRAKKTLFITLSWFMVIFTSTVYYLYNLLINQDYFPIFILGSALAVISFIASKTVSVLYVKESSGKSTKKK